MKPTWSWTTEDVGERLKRSPILVRVLWLESDFPGGRRVLTDPLRAYPEEPVHDLIPAMCDALNTADLGSGEAKEER